MSGARFRVREATETDLAGVVEMERSLVEAPHWGEAEYAAIIAADRSADGALRRCLLVARAEEGAERMLRETKNAPQRLKPHYEQNTCGTAEAVPLSETDFSAPSEGRLLGFAVGKVIGFGPGELESVAVDPAARRGGVGRALCEAVIDWCEEQGVGVVELEVRAGSGAAIGLYERLGFVEVGRRKGYYREPVEDASLMKLQLAGGDRGE